MLWVWGCEEKANEGEQIKKKRKRGQFPQKVFFSKRIQENFLKGKKVSERICSLFALKKSCTRNAKILIKVALV